MGDRLHSRMHRGPAWTDSPIIWPNTYGGQYSNFCTDTWHRYGHCDDSTHTEGSTGWHSTLQHSTAEHAHQITAVLAQIPPRRVQSQTRLKAQYGIAIQRSTLQCSAVICYAKYQRPPLTGKSQRREAAAPALQRPRHRRRALVPDGIPCAAPTPPAAHAQRTLSPRAGWPHTVDCAVRCLCRRARSLARRQYPSQRAQGHVVTQTAAQ